MNYSPPEGKSAQSACRTASLSAEEIQACLERILASEEFAGSVQLSRFLRYIVENALPGKGAILKESVIGVEVFHRGSSYDPKADPIVRVEARRLRTRLQAYYKKSGLDEPIRVSLPKGGYVPAFEIAAPSVEEEKDGSEITAPITAPPARREFSRLWILAGGVALCAVIAAAFIYREREPQRLVASFWSSLLEGEQPALLIPADSSLVVLENLSHQSVSLPEYISGSYRARMIESSGANHDVVSIYSFRRYTSIADLEFATKLAHRPEAGRLGLSTRYARDVRVGDLKGRNVILLGARQANPWVGLFEKDATFRLDDDEQTAGLRIVNLAPQQGEETVIERSPAQMANEIYAIITYHRNVDSSGVSLLVAGMSVAGTEAAADFVLDDNRLGPWLRKAEVGGEIRDFDVLLRGRNLAGSAPRAEVVAFHVKPSPNSGGVQARAGGTPDGN